MKKLKIVMAPSSTLQQVSEKVTKVDSDTKQLMQDMLELMYKTNGIGLAAPQVGVNKRIVVIDTSYSKEEDKPKQPLYFINPEIIKSSTDLRIYHEGCLSVPNIFYDVERPDTCTVKALDLNGKEFTMDCEGVLATCIQHEVDHLNGILFVDHLSKLKKDRALKKLKKAKKNKEYSEDIFHM